MGAYRFRKKIKNIVHLLTFAFGLVLFQFVWLRYSGKNSTFQNIHYYNQKDEVLLVTRRHLQLQNPGNHNKPCTMLTCFDFTKCLGEFKVYVYPIKEETKVSLSFAKILKAIFRSQYYTDDPKQACLFVPSLDPLDRDKLSVDYQSFLEKTLNALPFWNDGKNHIIFNLFSGTYPDYKDILDIDIGKAILVKASVSSESFRRNFDISLPLFSKIHPLSGAGYLPRSTNIFPFNRKYWVSFKGKRYLKGIGSETRSAFYKIHNGRDIILLTTCRHGKHWRENQDQRCAKDNELFERYCNWGCSILEISIFQLKRMMIDYGDDD